MSKLIFLWKILILYIFYANPVIAGSLQEDTKTFPVEVFYLEDSGWLESEIENLLEITSDILSQCNIIITHKGIKTLKGSLPNGNLYLYNREKPNSDRVGGEMDLIRSLNLKKRDKILIFFIREFDYPKYGVARFSKITSESLLENTVFISLSEKELDDRNTLAHELGHILTDEGHFHYVEPNIMHYDQYRINSEFTASQCEKMHKKQLL